MTDIYEKYGVTREEVMAWAQKHPEYRAFLNSGQTLLTIYLSEARGTLVDVADVQTVTGTKVDVKDIKEGESVVVEVIVGRKLRETSYMGCPTCYKSIPKEGPPECPNHGEVTPVSHTFSRYVAADNSGEMILSFGPRLTASGEDYMGKIVRVRGTLNDQGEFNISMLNVIGGKGFKGVVSTEEGMEEKATELVNKAELEKFNTMLRTFPSMAKEDVERWHKEWNIKTPLSLLLYQSGAEEFEEDGKTKYRYPEETE